MIYMATGLNSKKYFCDWSRNMFSNYTKEEAFRCLFSYAQEIRENLIFVMIGKRRCSQRKTEQRNSIICWR